jgi:hypothetical protein
MLKRTLNLYLHALHISLITDFKIYFFVAFLITKITPTFCYQIELYLLQHYRHTEMDDMFHHI